MSQDDRKYFEQLSRWLQQRDRTPRTSDDEDDDVDPRLQRQWENIRRERAENVAQRSREVLDTQRRANELARIEAEWEDRCHCGRRYSLCTLAQRLARYPRPSEIYVPDPTRPPQRRIVTGIDLTDSDEGVEVELEVKIKGPDQK
jgi:hypothetical protein